MSAQPAELVAAACREWLLMSLPAKVAEVNLTRAAYLTAPFAGPYAVPAGSTLGIIPTANSSTAIPVTLTTGAPTRTAAQLATDINATSGLSGVASADSNGRLKLTSPTPPSGTSVSSKIELRGGVASDINATLGFHKGGEKCVRTPLVTPMHQDVMDGWPLLGVMQSRGKGVVVVVLGDKQTREDVNLRKQQNIVTMDVNVLRQESEQQVDRNREHIYAAARCVFELMLSNSGRRFGRVGDDAIQLVHPSNGRFFAKPLHFATPDAATGKLVGPFFDGAVFTVQIRVQENQS